MTAKQIKNRGFTLVELLIVIVIIAILTIISLVAYNGIQNRARTTTAESTAKSLADKVQLYYSDKGAYPAANLLTEATNKDALINSVNVNEPWHIDTNSIKIGTPAQTASPETVSYQKCNDNGARVSYWDYTAAASDNPKTRNIGDQNGCK